MLTAKMISDRLNLSIAKVYALIQSGKLQCYRFGRSVRVSEKQLEDFLKASKDQIIRPNSRFRNF